MTSRIFSFFEDSQLVLKPYKNHWGKHRAHRARQRKQGNRKGCLAEGTGYGFCMWKIYYTSGTSTLSGCATVSWPCPTRTCPWTPKQDGSVLYCFIHECWKLWTSISRPLHLWGFTYLPVLWSVTERQWVHSIYIHAHAHICIHTSANWVRTKWNHIFTF